MAHFQRYKTMAIHIRNSAENQPWQLGGLDEGAFDFSTGVEATYKVEMAGRMIDLSDDEDSDSDEEEENDPDAMDHDGTEKKTHKPKPAPKNMSHYFKAISVEFDRPRSLQPDGMASIEWKKPSFPVNSSNPPPAADFSNFVFRRKGDENMNITISIFRDENPEVFTLSPELANLLDAKEETKAGAVMLIWEYAKLMNLLEDEEKRVFRCDKELKAVCSDTKPCMTLLIALEGLQNRLSLLSSSPRDDCKSPPPNGAIQTQLHYPR
jgi:SWI/SNF-related matrix-associated actin-dependent regulator of chromatin subfamily D